MSSEAGIHASQKHSSENNNVCEADIHASQKHTTNGSAAARKAWVTRRRNAQRIEDERRLAAQRDRDIAAQNAILEKRSVTAQKAAATRRKNKEELEEDRQEALRMLDELERGTRVPVQGA